MIGSLAAAIALASALAPESPPIQRPTASPPSVTAEPVAPPPAAEPSADVAPDVAPDATVDVAAEPAAAEPTAAEPVAAEPEPASLPDEPASVAAVESAPDDAAPTSSDETLTVATERAGPPFYSEEDLAQLRARHEVEAEPPAAPQGVRWRCLVADPTCRHSFEIQAMGAYARRVRQGDVARGTLDRWNSARAQYDFWASLPALVETRGKVRYTRMSLGPKGGVTFSDTGDLWGNLGIAGRYWLGRGRWAPNIEFTSALSFKLGTRAGNDIQAERFRLQRGPVGFSADVGFGLGGFGAIVFGGQYDSPLAREEVPEEFRVVSSGMFYVGFRGNIVWGGPAVAAVAAHASTRAVEGP